MSEKNDNKEIIELLKDSIYLNSIIATELIKITENTSRIARGKMPPQSCLKEHTMLEKMIIAICEKHAPNKIEVIKKHVLKHD